MTSQILAEANQTDGGSPIVKPATASSPVGPVGRCTTGVPVVSASQKVVVFTTAPATTVIPTQVRDF